MNPLTPEFAFASFTFPRYIATLPKWKGSALATLKHSAEMRGMFGAGYYHAPKPITGGAHPGAGFYLDSDGMPALRWEWADEIQRLGHSP